MSVRVADYIADYLEEIGVRSLFLVSGGGMMHLLDAVGRKEKLKYYCNHHEQAGGFAADAYARQTRSLGVAYGTSGPGATNLVTAIENAWLDSTPILFVTGQSKLSQTIEHSGLKGLRQFGGFEVNIVPIVESITKSSVFLNDPLKIRYELERACYLALEGRPGPVLIDIPVDIQGARIEPSELEGFTPPAPTVNNVVTRDTITEVVDKIKNAKRPLILSGHGISCSGEEGVALFRRVISSLNVPVVTSQLGKDIIEFDHDLLVGNVGLKGDRPGNMAVQKADLVLTLGCSLHVFTTGYELELFAPDAYKIQVELDPWILKRENVGVQSKIQASVQDFLGALDVELNPGTPLVSPSGWHEECRIWKRELSVMKESHERTPNGINYYDLCDVLSDVCDEKTTVTADAGSAFYVIGQAFRVKKGQRVLVCGSLGQMGYAVPAATGVCTADPDRTVVCVTGDGSLQTNVHELAVLKHHGFNAKIFIVNNGGYVSIRNTQNSFFEGHLVGTSEDSGVFIPSTEKIAEAYGISFRRVEHFNELRGTVEEVIHSKGPVICEVVTPPQQKIIPLVTSRKLEDGTMVANPLDQMSPELRRDL